ncbi:hypothetical protein [Palleronia caenipelagi]|uniref:Glycoside hydrolase family 104 protein n=1 Tax=Palleronia caenipelagi TaxID=2489174 RepID=A0A547PNS8_9RHOB|nr:hypothetical protein [Palleronia caenipelagi]TRD15775.1 hypothetical protein FEV53_15045 [Palleronia caenipelagi]
MLRYVWKNHEVHRTDGASHPPASVHGTAEQPEGIRRLRPLRSPLRPVTVLLLVLLPGVAIGQEWGSEGRFELNGKSAPIGVKWSADPFETRWRQTRNFELGTPGKKPPKTAGFRLPSGSRLDQLGALIQLAESPRGGYDAVHGSAKRRPPGPPSRLTLAQIYAWIQATPGQHHAIGKYQIIPSTLRGLQLKLGVPDGARFSPQLQDQFASVLYVEAGYNSFIQGRLPLASFMDNLAKIWAGLPTRSGRSHYHGYAGNRATISRAFFDQQMRKIFGA